MKDDDDVEASLEAKRIQFSENIVYRRRAAQNAGRGDLVHVLTLRLLRSFPPGVHSSVSGWPSCSETQGKSSLVSTG